MRPHYLSRFFAPQSLAVVGASDRPDSVGAMVLRSLAESGYRGRVFAVNPRMPTIEGVQMFSSLQDLPERVDLAIAAVPPEALLEVVAGAGAAGVQAMIVMTAVPPGSDITARLLELARRHGVRIMGPGSFGVMRPSIGLNASFVRTGSLALVSDSAALTNAILDWAAGNDVGFSTVVSPGESCDVDLSEVLDFLVSDGQTESILLHIGVPRRPRFFLSALRAAARIKPVIALKSGRHDPGANGRALPFDSDASFEAALRRAGVVRVRTFAQLFSAAKACSVRFRPSGSRLALISNGMGPARLGVDHAIDLGITLAQFSDTTVATLDTLLPPGPQRANPLNLTDRADDSLYAGALDAAISDPAVDGAIVLLSPQALARPLETAAVVTERALATAKPVLACWMGDLQVVESRRVFARSRVPNFRTPESAVEAFSFICAYQESQRMLLQMPPSVGHHEPPDVEGARLIIESVLEERRSALSETEAKALLAAFHIPVTRTFVTHSANDAMVLAQQLGFPVALKVNSPDIEHKSEVGGVRLNVENAHDLRSAFKDILARVAEAAPQARVQGVSVEPMVRARDGREIVVGIGREPMFGPVLYMLAGGTSGALLSRTSVALPPLNAFLAGEFVRHSDVARLLAASGARPAADVASLELVLQRVSEIACELPEVVELAINPLIVQASGAFAVDVRIAVAPVASGSGRYGHMAIHPYPTHLEKIVQLRDGTEILIRPIRPEDAEREQAFVRNLSETSRYYRFMDALHELPRSLLARFTQIDYDREMALVGVTVGEAEEQQIGVARYVINPDGESCEFALVVSDAWHGRGIGTRLMNALMDVARTHGLRAIEGEVLANNQGMLKLMTALGFKISKCPDDATLKIVNKAL